MRSPALACFLASAGAVVDRGGQGSIAFLQSKNERAVTSLTESSSKLTVLYNSVLDAYSQELSFYDNIISTCKDQVRKSGLRVADYDLSLSGAKATQVQQGAIAAGAQTQLDHLTSEETDAKESYDSTVAQRANDATAFDDWNATSATQVQVSNDILKKLQDKRAIIAATDNTSSSASELDYIIGIFSNIVSTVEKSATDQASQHTEKDADLLKLVGSYKTSLQHVDAQYREQNDARLAATAQYSKGQKIQSTMESFKSKESGLDSIRQQMCGTSSVDSKTGAAHQLKDALAYGFTSFDREVQQTLEIMKAMIALEPHDTAAANPALLALPKKTIAKTQLVEQKPTGAVTLFQELAVPQRRLDLPAYPRQMTQLPTESTLQFINATFAEALAKVLPGNLAARALSVLSSTQGVAANRTDPATDDCVARKQSLTAEIIAARQARRIAKSAEKTALAAADDAAYEEGQCTTFVEAISADQAAVSSLNMNEASAGFRVQVDHLRTDDMEKIAADVKEYVDAGAPAQASGLPILLTKIQASMQDMENAVSSDSTSKLGQLKTLVSELDSKHTSAITAINGEKSAATQRKTDQSGIATTEENKKNGYDTQINTLMGQRTALETSAECR